MWDVWFECQIVCFKIEHLWIINKMDLWPIPLLSYISHIWVESWQASRWLCGISQFRTCTFSCLSKITVNLWDLFIKIRKRTEVKLLLFLYDFLWINKWFIPKVQHFKGKASLDFETSYLKTLHHWSFNFLVRHWQNDSCYPIRNLVAYQKRSIFCCFSKCLSAIGWTDFCSKHSVELIH